ncbi:MAG: hypothetical protein H0T79_06955 [Deltaproteobacteria bacterium]|nr:hypothetical protein [Deltaproteobacteria bacterium]
MTRAIAVLLALGVGIAASDARAETFEEKATGAMKIAQLDELVWVTTATCDRGDDVINRQCRRVRDSRLAELEGKPLLVEASPTLFTVSPWNSAKKSAQVTLSGCLACEGIAEGGKTWLVLATAPRVDDGKLSAAPISDKALPFASDEERTKFAMAVHAVRVELVVELAKKPRWQLAGKDGISLDVLAYRVVSPCNGNVVLSAPASGSVPPNPKACTK